jgi:hypothetical protein
MQLEPNLSAAEIQNASSPYFFFPTATGFQSTNDWFPASQTFIYIAIRRGPMKVPTSGTSVFLPSTAPATTPFNVGFPPDMALWAVRDGTGNRETSTRLQGGSLLYTNSTAAEMSGYDIGWASKTNFWYQNVSGGSMINWLFRRAPSFCDVVCWSGAGANLVINHNLQAVPELIINKYRNGTSYGWATTAAGLVNPNTNYLTLNSSNAEANAGATPGFIYNRTSTTFTVSSDLAQSGFNWVSYLFATCPGVSKVGSYTGNGTTQTINCGFGAGGARFVLIKRIDDVGDWYTYDTARGMTTLTDPYTLLNTNTAETATLGSVTTVSTGFALNSAILAAINVNAGTYIFLAIA